MEGKTNAGRMLLFFSFFSSLKRQRGELFQCRPAFELSIRIRVGGGGGGGGGEGQKQSLREIENLLSHLKDARNLSDFIYGMQEGGS